MIAEVVVGLLVVYIAAALRRRSRLRTAQLRADGDQWYLDRYDELIAWAEKTAWPNRLELVVDALADDVARALFPGRYTQPDVRTTFTAIPCSTDAHLWEYETLPNGAKKATCHRCDQWIEEVAPQAQVIRTADRDVAAGRCINDREHDWITEKIHSGDGRFVRRMDYCPDCRQTVRSIEIAGQDLRDQLKARHEHLKLLAESWQNNGGDFVLTTAQHAEYLKVVREIQEIKAALERQKLDIYAAFSVPPALTGAPH